MLHALFKAGVRRCRLLNTPVACLAAAAAVEGGGAHSPHATSNRLVEEGASSPSKATGAFPYNP